MDANDLARYEKANRTTYVRAKRQWVVVANPGTDSEHVVIECNTFKSAQRWCREGMDIMKRLPNGLFTTEY